MKFELKPYNRDASDEDLISDLKKIASGLNKDTLTTKIYNEKGRFSSSTLIRRIGKGSWLKVLEKANLKKSREYNISEEEFFKNLEEIWIKLGRQPYPSDMKKPLSRYSYAAYKREFNKWRKALEQFIEHINKEDIPTTEKLSSKPIISKKHKTPRNVNLRLRFIVMRRDDFKCKIDGRSPATHPGLELRVDHIIAWDNGGETVLENLQTLCKDCNSGKSNLDFTLK